MSLTHAVDDLVSQLAGPEEEFFWAPVKMENPVSEFSIVNKKEKLFEQSCQAQ